MSIPWERREHHRYPGVLLIRVLIILHSGQTGVERGAHEAARACGLGIAGFMPPDARDELGPLPSDVSQWLTKYPQRSRRAALRSTLQIASCALVVVPDAPNAERFPAMSWVFYAIRRYKLPMLVCDPDTSFATLRDWIAPVTETCGSRRLVITGPRATRWPLGETVARRLVRSLAMELALQPDPITGWQTF